MSTGRLDAAALGQLISLAVERREHTQKELLTGPSSLLMMRSSASRSVVRCA